MGVASVGQSTCPFCGQALSFKGFQTHMKANHPEYVAAEEKWDRDFRKDFGKVALPGVVVWIIAILFLFFATQPVELYFLGLVVAVIVLMGISVVYAHHATAVDIRALKAFHRRCQICGAEVPGGQIADHIRSVHPEERRYLIEARTYALGTPRRGYPAHDLFRDSPPTVRPRDELSVVRSSPHDGRIFPVDRGDAGLASICRLPAHRPGEEDLGAKPWDPVGVVRTAYARPIDARVEPSWTRVTIRSRAASGFEAFWVRA